MIFHIDKVRFSRLAMTSAVMSMLFLSGCAAFNKPVEQPVKSDYEIAIEKELDAAIKRVAAQPRWSATMDDKAQFASFASDSISVSYQGDVIELMKAVASARGRTFSVTGPSPRPPVFIFMDAKEMTFENFLRDIDKQLGQRADIAVGDDYLEVRYR